MNVLASTAIFIASGTEENSLFLATALNLPFDYFFYPKQKMNYN